MDRRTFASAALLTAAAPLISAAPALADSSEQEKDAKLTRTMLAALERELDDRATAAIMEPHIEDIGFNWHPPTKPVDGIDFIIAYGFGNRRPAGGGDPSRVLYEPGPVNEALADTVAKLRAQRNVPVYAQWEIARFLDSKYHMSDVTSIEPVISADGTIVYLSTDGVAAQVKSRRAGLPAGIAGVVGFRDHIKRCVQTTRDRGMDAFAPEDIDMPGTYDPESGQSWTRRRDLYLVHDMYAQMAVLRGKLIAQAYPNG
ncbi:hypothetical protein [Arthrobacter sp. MMS18-M83]|uniref:hypothetical protein n=1 Tax=Arthrobacter sp. MMS18-M83 TaxID=2996261 RepID=UPI00227BF6F6|nr:hypothetical protein [Arthrobacter sp. MMS18-M83]WAH98529.1 hypothetical protein OW521_06680 [Arthrobacter sp. MMS18-M83]